MKCKVCNGTGKITAIDFSKPDWKDKEKACPICCGSGIIKQTNENWFCSLPTEKKAKWLSQCSQILYDCGQRDVFPKIMYEEDWELWLKQPHTTIKE